MKVIAAIADNNGIMFNNRRLSKDATLIDRILNKVEHVYVSPYTAKLFKDHPDNITVVESFDEIPSDGWLFIEDDSLYPYFDSIDEVILYRWNRDYPADTFFHFPEEEYEMISEEDFAGSAHDEITEFIFKRNKNKEYSISELIELGEKTNYLKLAEVKEQEPSDEGHQKVDKKSTFSFLSKLKRGISLTLVSLVVLCTIIASGCTDPKTAPTAQATETQLLETDIVEETRVESATSAVQTEPAQQEQFSLKNIPTYSGTPYVQVNNGTPFFTKEQLSNTKSYEYYSDLDSLGRCGECIACVGQDLMPTQKRGDISSVKPSGWKNKKYDFVDGGYIYNRCHLIGFQLAGENDNEKNLITGTRYMNVDGMLPFENLIADFVKAENLHVLYRVTPIYDGNNLVASGVLMEAQSVEDDGEEIMFNVFCYNVQPGITIDYATGDNWLDTTTETTSKNESNDEKSETFIVNKNSKKFHLPSCDSVSKMSAKNKQEVKDTYSNMIKNKYDPCSNCLKGR